MSTEMHSTGKVPPPYSDPPMQAWGNPYPAQGPMQGGGQQYPGQGPMQGGGQQYPGQGPMQGGSQPYPGQGPMQGGGQPYPGQGPMQAGGQQYPGQGPQVIHVVSNVQPAVGPESVSMQCPTCHENITTVVTRETSNTAHFWALGLCLLGCWLCCCIPYCVDSMKNVNHTCPKCRSFLGTYRH